MKKIIISIVLIVALLLFPLYNLSHLSSEKDQSSAKVSLSAIELLDALSSFDVGKAQGAVIAAEKKREDPSGNKEKINNILKKLKTGKTTYRKVFKNVYIVGDSLMNGLEAYDILNSNHLITQVSASLYHLSDNMEKIIEIKPPVLIIHYGVNMISTDKVLKDNFIKFYTKLIKQLKKELPDTRIIVSGIFPVDREVATAKRFGKIEEYNKALKQMCKSLKVEYLDSSPVLKKHPECYGSDGIHLSKEFYEKYWLRYIIQEMEIGI